MCNETGTLLSTDGLPLSCNSSTGQCRCKQFVQGLQCDQCVDGYWNLQTDNPNGCQRTFTSVFERCVEIEGGGLKPRSLALFIRPSDQIKLLDGRLDHGMSRNASCLGKTRACSLKAPGIFIWWLQLRGSSTGNPQWV